MASIMRRMNTISRCELLYRSQKLGDKLPGIYHVYVLVVCRNPGMSQEAIAKRLCINKSTVARHLAFLEQNGYITRTAGKEDKREMLVFPTKKMLDIHPDVVEITKEWNKLLAEGITEEELEIFHSVLDKMFEKSTQIIYQGE